MERRCTPSSLQPPRARSFLSPLACRSHSSVRKQIKIRPGFTPQEDVRRFRGTKQAQMDSTALPKGHIIGWAPPPKSTAASTSEGKPLSKSAKKNAKRKEKREKEKTDDVPDNWDDDDDDEAKPAAPTPSATKSSVSTAPASSDAAQADSADGKSKDAKITQSTDDALVEKLDKLEVK
ncbi:hypothetical protein HYPSUDRAFT_32034 [Hypholoma sublateritium FD-334 SS-4]|uniref:WIBG Mago-binding domain-containing protein n=1 Tax=Hypholoma sublateritium (strain FD-334 SS-4) TaxID=945553 RepID=A0A0D2LPD6_HYPSF|nr:hypothetical protein HYPSUDRAFT_32034 [Hypholoma sublateritium FD-334 SS-4]